MEVIEGEMISHCKEAANFITFAFSCILHIHCHHIKRKFISFVLFKILAYVSCNLYNCPVTVTNMLF